jgi:hypothetical protein
LVAMKVSFGGRTRKPPLLIAIRQS